MESGYVIMIVMMMFLLFGGWYFYNKNLEKKDSEKAMAQIKEEMNSKLSEVKQEQQASEKEDKDRVKPLVILDDSWKWGTNYYPPVGNTPWFPPRYRSLDPYPHRPPPHRPPHPPPRPPPPPPPPPPRP
jgi:hypothetical protein